jgi:hypothetical protein
LPFCVKLICQKHRGYVVNPGISRLVDFFIFFVANASEPALYSENRNLTRFVRGADMPETDKFYIERCLDGHPDDFRYLVRRYQAVLLAQLAGKLGDKERAEEAAQETFVRAYFNMNKLQRPQSFFPWLLGIAGRVAKEHHRKEKIHRQRENVRSYSEQVSTPGAARYAPRNSYENFITGLCHAA